MHQQLFQLDKLSAYQKICKTLNKEALRVEIKEFLFLKQQFRNQFTFAVEMHKKFYFRLDRLAEEEATY